MRNPGFAALSLALMASACDSPTPGTVVTPTPTPSPSASATATPTPSVSALTPARAATGAYKDTRLQIAFDAVPTIGTTGTIKVFKSDGTLVDTIDISGAPVTAGGETQTRYAAVNTEIDKIGNNVANLTQWRFVYYRPITVSGNTATIQLHDNVLDWSTGYYVTIDNGVLVGNVGGSAFRGTTGIADWTFATKAAPASQTDVTVDDDGVADFRSVQGALDWQMATGCVSASCPNSAVAKTITMKNGTYTELMFARNISNLTIRGESRAGTVVRADNFEAFNPSTGGSRTAANTTFSNIGGDPAMGTRRSLGGGRPVLLIEGGDNLRLTNFTLQNTHVKDAVTNSQAETMYFNSATLTGSRLAATDMNFLSTQDTVQVKGWVWFHNSLIAGDVDFIWGTPFAVLIENSEIRTVVDTAQPSSGGYIFQARSAKGYPGFVVLNSSLTSATGVPAGSTYLARSGGNVQPTYCTTQFTTGSIGNANLYCDNVAYINTKMGDHIAAAGWWIAPVPNLAPSATEGWRESGSTRLDGSALSLTGRNTAYATTSANLSPLSTRAGVFSQWNNGVGWNPAP